MAKRIILSFFLAFGLTALLTSCGYKAPPQPPGGEVEQTNKPPESRDY